LSVSFITTHKHYKTFAHSTPRQFGVVICVTTQFIILFNLLCSVVNALEENINLKTEYEAKVLDIDPNLLKMALESLGAVALGTTLQWRYVFDIIPGDKNQWLRLRSEREGITLSHKKITTDEIDGTFEASSPLNSSEDLTSVIKSAGLDSKKFHDQWEALSEKERNTENLLAYLKKLGIEPKSYQENRRTSFSLDECDIEIDEWPKIPPYLEIEGPEKMAVENMAARLGFAPEQLTSINTVGVYEKYGLDLADFRRLTFEA
jgi:adenylate cyclase class 2